MLRKRSLTGPELRPEGVPDTVLSSGSSPETPGASGLQISQTSTQGAAALSRCQRAVEPKLALSARSKRKLSKRP